MSFDLISPEDPRWFSALSISDGGIFYSPEYCSLHRENSCSPAMLLYQDDLGTAFDVTTLKDISSLPFYESVAAQFSCRPLDLANSIYNGPIAASDSTDHDELLRRYRKSLDQFCSENNVVTEFIRFHPHLSTNGVAPKHRRTDSGERYPLCRSSQWL